ncbi:hypothetical protein GCM10022392_05070 [Mucilaginibacter panaciglaebae]|uniref:Parallel beta helix pectate lyase-like protein n=1 Tax=Mucilaginibacter panaciglaebae TaxID=502331 RepID=A0ABP7WEL1_9SPHI
MPAGYVKDGSKDYTTYLQDAINKYTDITFPAFPIMVNDKGLVVGSNKTLTFLAGSKLIVKPSSNGNYNIIDIVNASNVTLNSPVIVGDRYVHLGTSGEWGMGIGIYGSSKVTVNNATITNCWGDGITVEPKKGVSSSAISINNAYCNYNRRNGMSITSVIGMTVESSYFGHTNGVLPCAGIDIEPNSSTDELQQVTISNTRTEYNTGTGISTGLKNLFGGSNKKMSLTVINHIDKGSADAFRATATLTRRVGSETVSGDIIVTNPYWRQNTNTPIQTNILVKTIKLTVTKPTVQDVNGNQLNNASILALFTYKTNINRDANYVITF